MNFPLMNDTRPARARFAAPALMLCLAAPNAQARQGAPNAITTSGLVPAKSQVVVPSAQGGFAGVAALTVSGGSDSCANPDLISGTGLFPFDNSTATTGAEGQHHPQCAQVGGIGIAHDVWYVWVAPSSGTVLFSTCGLTSVDTKVGIWDLQVVGSNCPSTQAGMLACFDDLSPSIVQTKAVFNVTAGLSYLIQLGTFPGDQSSPPHLGGTGSFSLDYLPIADATACSADDGESDQVLAVTLTPGAGSCMFARHGRLGSTARVSAIEVVWGSLGNAAASTLVDGAPASVAIWEDPNDDGNPADAVLLEEKPTAIHNHDTDIYNVEQLATSHLVSGYYFVGAIYRNPATVGQNHHPFPIDWDNLEVLPYNPSTSQTPIRARAFIGFNEAGAFNALDLSLSGFGGSVRPILGGLFSVGYSNYAYNTIPLIRPTCWPEVGQSFCSNDTLGVDHTTPCPCGNNGSAGHGCANSFTAAGARLVAYGDIGDDAFPTPGATPVILSCAGLPATSFTMFLQHSSPGDSIFHDGVLCAGGALIRLRGRNAGAGSGQPSGVAVFPNSGFSNDSTLTLSSRGGVTVGSSTTRFYSAWYRNASTTFCPPATANVSNGWVIAW